MAGDRAGRAGRLGDLGGGELAVWNPIEELAEVAVKATMDAWTTMLLAIWEAGLWVLAQALSFMDTFLTPDLSADGPGGLIYRTAFWVSAALAVMMGMLQLGLAAFRRDGATLGRLVLGVAQYGLVWVGWLGYAVLLLQACSALTRALMASLLGVTEWSTWEPFEPLDLGDGVERWAAGVLGLMGLLLWVGAIGHLLVMLTRAGALIVLAASTPIAAAGLLGDTGRSWFWKSFRWFHAAALTPVLTVLVLGIGVQMSTSVVNGRAEGAAAALGTVVPGVLLILMGTFSPLVLFKLLAFTDPGTSSGAGMRAGLSANGGVQGLLSRGGGSSAASTVSPSGAAAGESAAGAATAGRFAAAGSVLGPVGAAAGAALAVMHSAGTRGVAIGADMTNMMGVGHGTYIPDFSGRSPQVPQRDRAVPEVHGAEQATGSPDAPAGTDPGAVLSAQQAAAGPARPGAAQ